MNTIFKKSQLFSCLIIVIFSYMCLLINTPRAWAHTPHDDVFQVVISPEYQKDKTLFTIVRGNLFKSEDRGRNWQRIVKGLDHKHRLYTLDISAQTPQKLYLASLGDGVYKSQNGGNSWKTVNHGLDNLQIDLLVISPTNSNRVLAAEKFGGLYQTEDGGENWHQVIDNQKINTIAFTTESQTVFAGDKQGNLLISQDGGQIWRTVSKINQQSITAIAISPRFNQDRTLFIATATGKVYQSTDGGISSTKISSIEEQPILSLVITPNSNLYAVAAYQGVFKSTDRGNSWQELSRGLTGDDQAKDLERPYYSTIAFSPDFERDNNLFLAGYDGLFKSDNGGQSWQEQETLSNKTIVGLGISPNYSQDGTVAVGTYVWGGYLSGDRGEDWQDINRGLIESQRLRHKSGISRVFDPIFSPQYSSDRTIFATTWYGIHKSTNRGKNWHNLYWWDVQPQNSPWWTRRSQGVTVALSPIFKSDRTIYLGTMEGHILKSSNGGKDFSLISQLDAPITDLNLSPNFAQDHTLYAAIPDKVYQSDDGGKTWTSASKGITFNQQYDPRKEAMMQLAISPDFKTDGTIFLGTSEGIWQTQNQGANWHKLTPNAYGDDSYIEGITISPTFKSDRMFLVSVRGKGLFKTRDGGKTFTAIGKELIDNNITLANLFGFSLTGVSPPIQFSPDYARDRTIFGFADKQVFRSQDGGDTWQALTLPIPQSNWLTYLYFDYLRLTLHPKLAIALTSFTAFLIYLLRRLRRSRFRVRIKQFSFKA